VSKVVFKVLKWFGLLVAALILLLAGGVAIVLVPDHIAFRRTHITDILVHDGRYDPAEHFSLERACTFNMETELYRLGYERLDWTSVPDPDVFWEIALIDDHNKTYRILYAFEPEVSRPEEVCNDRITLRTETEDGHLAAYVVEARGR
jgi:hypothetical protein